MCYCQYKSKRKKHAVRTIRVTEDGEIGLNRLKNDLQLPWKSQRTKSEHFCILKVSVLTSFLSATVFNFHLPWILYSGQDLKLNYKRLDSCTALWIQWPKKHFTAHSLSLFLLRKERLSALENTHTSWGFYLTIIW